MEPTLEKTVCLICFEITEKHIFVPPDIPEKMISCCTTFLHSTLTKETLKNYTQLSNEKKMLCKHCFHSSLELTQLSEKLTSIQKSISDLAVAFSMAVFHRRSQVYSLSQKLQNDSENSSSTIEFYEACLPPNLFLIKNEDKNIDLQKTNHDVVIESLHSKTDPNVKVEISADKIDNLSGNRQSLTVIDDTEIRFNKENVDSHGAIEQNKNLATIDEIRIVHVAGSSDSNSLTDGNSGRTVTKQGLLKSVKFPQIRLERIKIEGPKDGASVVNSCQTTDEPLQNIFEETQCRDDNVSDLTYVPTSSRSEKRLKCFYCEKSFTSASLRTRHLKIHTGEKPHKCSFCKKSFGSGSNLRSHERIHTGKKPFKCTYCEKRFISKSTMKCHEVIHDEAEKPYKCAYCQKGFLVKSTMLIHERCHTGEKPFECSLCNKSFAQVSTRNKHEKLHRRVKIFKCSFPSCVEIFTSKLDLQNHEMQHAAERPYKCLHCERMFKTISDKCEHQKTHNTHFSLICPICNLECSSPALLIAHEKTHSQKTNVFQCSFCEMTFSQIEDRNIHEKIHGKENENVIVGI